ncbi:MAG: PilZ domain-containing protein [Deltaproteobacteria bacterium]|nr:PilZ domain-containing protein [Deltaproteobacteria bacterium]
MSQTKSPDKPPVQALAVGAPKVERRTGSRSNVALPVMCRYDSVLDFVATQSMNISESGMFIVTDKPPMVGSRIDFNFSLADGFTLLHGSAEVMRVVTTGPVNGMGVRFVNLDATNQALIARIVEVNSQEGRNSTMSFDFARHATMRSMPVVQDPPPEPAAAALPVQFNGRAVRVILGPVTAPYFTQNPLLNVRSGGFFIPAEEDAPLGTVFQVEIVDNAGRTVVAGKGKVVAKQDMRIGLRLADVDKTVLAALRTEVEKFGSGK